MNIKARLGDQLRRTTLNADTQTYNNLFGRLATLFSKPNLATTHNVKYQDDEGDWVDMSSDEELQIALSLARQQGYALQLTLSEKTEKDKSEPSSTKASPVDPFNVSLEQVADKFLVLAQQWAPVVERLAASAAEVGLSADSIAERLASIQIIPEPVAAEKVVHNAWCDRCRARIAGVRFKCMECPDFDFCSDCMANHRPTHPPHDFILIERPGKCPMSKEEPPKEKEEDEEPVHWAICDNCDERIRGIRHKCNDCADYDLCSGCIVHSPSIHPNHTFDQIEKPSSEYSKCHAAAPKVAVPEPSPVVEAAAPEPSPVEEAPVEPVVEAAAPVEEAEPQVEVSQMEKMQSALVQLEEMGFSDRRHNVQILMRNNGDIVNTIVELITELN